MRGHSKSNAPNAYLALGTNLGDRRENLREAVRLLTESDSLRLRLVASLYETAPVGGPQEQSDYFNSAISISTRLDAPTLLKHCLDVERMMGRVRKQANGPRNIDIDMLIYEDLQIELPDLTIPHPRMHLRRFVLTPMVEIAPDLRHPAIGATMKDLLDQLAEDDGKVRCVETADWCQDFAKENFAVDD